MMSYICMGMRIKYVKENIMNKKVFRAYDIRGIYNKDIDENDIKKV